MQIRSKIPATIVTGFLGAGKTTLLRHLIATAAGRRLGIIVNEFGDIGIDGRILEACATPGCTADDVIELANGCLCCTVADDFLPAIERLIDRDDPPAHIIVETSGLALPKPLVKAFGWPEIRARVTVDGVVAVIDAPALADGRFGETVNGVPTSHQAELAELFADQLQCADLVVLNKADLVDDATLAALRARVTAGMRPQARIVATRFGAAPAPVVLGIAAQAEDDLAARPSHHDLEEGDHGHEAFASVALPVPPIADLAAFAKRVTALFTEPAVLRVKGFLRVAGMDRRLVLHGVGGRVQHHYDREWTEGAEGTLVVIGFNGLDRTRIAAALAAH